MKEYNKKNKPRLLKAKRKWHVDNHDLEIQYKRDWYQKHKKDNNDERRRIKQKVIDHYGGSCVVCGITDPDFLTLDHINNDGAEHRRKISGRKSIGFYIYRWLILNDFPKGIQVLCWNHNRMKYLEYIRLNLVSTTKAKWNRNHIRIVKQTVVNYYGGKCTCGETNLDLLTIDHVNGGGNEHRRQTFGSTRSFGMYKWLIENGFPPGFQVLCWNCNLGKHIRAGGTERGA